MGTDTGKRWRNAIGLGVGLGLLSLSGTACSGDDGGSGPGGESGGTLELGAVCARSAQCKQVAGKEVICDCAPDASETVCVALLDAGAACATGVNFEPGCRSDSACVGRNGPPKCEAYARLGEACTTAQCAPGTSCVNEVCGPAVALGQPCDSFEPQPCQSGAHCDFGDVCVADLVPGEACSSDDDCGPSGRCTSTNGAPPACVTIKKQGEACVGFFDCEDDLICDDDGSGTDRCIARSEPVQCGF